MIWVWGRYGVCVVVVVVDCVVSCAITGSDSASTTSDPKTTANSFLDFIRFSSLNVHAQNCSLGASIGSLIYERNTVQNGSRRELSDKPSTRAPRCENGGCHLRRSLSVPKLHPSPGSTKKATRPRPLPPAEMTGQRWASLPGNLRRESCARRAGLRFLRMTIRNSLFEHGNLALVAGGAAAGAAGGADYG